jgi:translocator protein
MIKQIKHQQLRRLPDSFKDGSAKTVAGARAAGNSLNTWYETLERPNWRPPKQVFARVRAVLLTLMSLFTWLVGGAVRSHLPLRNPARLAMGAWFAQLAVNLAWSGLFFAFRRLGANMHALTRVFTILAAYIIWTGRVARFTAWLRAPYLGWVSLTSALNLQLWRLNRGIISQATRHF